MTTQETIDYVKSLKASASKDTDKRAKKYVEAMDDILKLIDERRCLQNRCFVFSGGMMCGMCGMECNALGKELLITEKHRRKNGDGGISNGKRI